MNLSTVKWAQWDKAQSRELLGLFICVCIAPCTIVAHNIAQNRPDNFPSYPPDNHHCSDDVYLREGENTTSYNGSRQKTRTVPSRTDSRYQTFHSNATPTYWISDACTYPARRVRCEFRTAWRSSPAVSAYYLPRSTAPGNAHLLIRRAPAAKMLTFRCRRPMSIV